MPLPCVIMRDDMFFVGIFTFLVCLIPQGGWMYRFIQFNLIETCAIFFHENAGLNFSQNRIKIIFYQFFYIVLTIAQIKVVMHLC